MLWEAHITIVDDDIERWCAFCARFNSHNAAGMEVKPLYIELASGEHPKQLMFAARWEGQAGHGESALAALEARVRADFEVLRVKLECPLDKSHGLSTNDSSYSECHMKMLLPPTSARSVIDDACACAKVYASRNLLGDAVSDPDMGVLQKWYLTDRDHVSTPTAAASSFNQSLALVREVHPAIRMEMEYVVFDSNPALDRGWAE